MNELSGDILIHDYNILIWDADEREKNPLFYGMVYYEVSGIWT